MMSTRVERTKARVLKSAVDVLIDYGVEGFSVEEVTRRSGVAKTTIYRHWPSAATLQITALGEMVEITSTPNTGSLREDLIILYESISDMVEVPGRLKIMLGVLIKATEDPEYAAIKADLMDQRGSPLRTILQLAQARGEISAGLDIDAASMQIEGPFMARRLMGGKPIPKDEIPGIVDGALSGVMPRQGPTR